MAFPYRSTALTAALLLFAGTPALTASASAAVADAPSPVAAGTARTASVGASTGRATRPGSRQARPPSGLVGSGSATNSILALAATGYTYWGFYVWNASAHSWDYMKVGANDTKTLPKDGDVYGFRWALVVKDPRLPRANGDFSAICANVKPAAGHKRIAFVLDYGAASDAPPGDTPPAPQGVCADVSDGFTVQQALESVTQLRTGKTGIICGIGGYPSSGCGGQVADATEGPPDTKVTLRVPSEQAAGSSGARTGGPSTPGASQPMTNDSTGQGSTSNVWLIVVAAIVVVALAVGAVVLRQRQGAGH